VSEDRQPDRIAREIRDDILGGRFRPGERLPSERELARRMGVHRGSAREALRILAQQRLIDVGPGGSRVIPLHRARLDVLGDLLHGSRGPDPTLMAQLLDVHELLVVGAARLAVERASEAERDRALELLATLAEGPDRDDVHLAAVAALIELIAEASRNLVLLMVANGLRDVIATVVPVLRRSRPPTASLRPALVSLREALSRRDGATAEEAVRGLLRTHREHVLKQLEREPAGRPEPGAR